MSENPIKKDQISDEIDLREIILPIWKSRKQILTITFIFSIFGGIIGFLTPATYIASSTFLPQTPQNEAIGSGLGGLASLAGVNLNLNIPGGDISPSLYSTVISSDPFKESLLNSKIYFNSDSLSYKEYILMNKNKSFLEIFKSGIFTSDVNLINLVSSKISISIENNEGFVKLSVTENNPIVAFQVTSNTQKLLQSWIIDYKIKNSKEHYEFVKEQYLEKEKEFFAVQNELSFYMDANQNINPSKNLIRLNRLQSKFDLINAVYLDLARQKEQASLQLNKSTPVFNNLNPASIPTENNGPSLTIYVTLFSFFGFFLSVIWILIKNPAKRIVLFLKNNK